MSIIYVKSMERDNRPRGREFACSPRIEMFGRVTQLTRFHQRADVEDLSGSSKRAKLCRDAAVQYGTHLITLTELNEEYKTELDRALTWLAGRDYEMHKSVNVTLEQARAARELERNLRKLAGMNGKKP